MNSASNNAVIWCFHPVMLKLLKKSCVGYALESFKNYYEKRLKRLGVYAFCIEELFL